MSKKERQIARLVNGGFTREQAEAFVEKMAGENEKPKATKKTEKAFTSFYGKSTTAELKKLASEIKPLREKYTGRISQYEEMEGVLGDAKTTLKKLRSQEAEMQDDWNIYESGDVQGYSFNKPSTWGKWLETVFNYYPEGHALHEKGREGFNLYKDLTENRAAQMEIKDRIYGEDPHQLIGGLDAGLGLKKSMDALKGGSEYIRKNLAEMEAEFRKRNKGQYLEGIEDLDPRVKTEADELLKKFISTIPE